MIGWDEAGRLAHSVTHGPRGLRKWPWYRSGYERMVAWHGYREMVDDARAEILTAIQHGFGVSEAVTVASAVLASSWRPLMADLLRGGVELSDWSASAVSAEDEWMSAGDADRSLADMLDRLRDAVTPRQWEVVEAVADGGSLAEAARRLGVSRQYVGRVMARVRAVG